MNDLVDTTEMYLRTVYELEEEGIRPIRARIVERLHQSGPTVSQTVARMERDGLVQVAEDRSLLLTEKGRNHAIEVMRRHRLAECLLVNVVGLELDSAHAEACKWEHVMSTTVERKLFEVLNHPAVSPYGTPIPGLDKLGVSPDIEDNSPDVPLSDPAIEDQQVAIIHQIEEAIQMDNELMASLRRSGIIPNARILVSNNGGVITLSTLGGDGVLIPSQYTHAIRVRAI